MTGEDAVPPTYGLSSWGELHPRAIRAVDGRHGGEGEVIEVAGLVHKRLRFPLVDKLVDLLVSSAEGSGSLRQVAPPPSASPPRPLRLVWTTSTPISNGSAPCTPITSTINARPLSSGSRPASASPSHLQTIPSLATDDEHPAPNSRYSEPLTFSVNLIKFLPAPSPLVLPINSVLTANAMRRTSRRLLQGSSW